MMNQRCYTLWDLPVRLFHWLLLATIITAWASVELDAMTLHVFAGQTALGLVVFRLVWGFIGTRTARFASFVRAPSVVLAYARDLPRQMKVLHLGHNPMGALSVLGLLAFILIQAVTGLFADDDVLTQGPLAHLVSSSTRELLTSIHKLNFDLLLILIGLHVAVIVLYKLKAGQNLVRAMIVGKACAAPGQTVEGEENTPTPWLRFVLAAGVGVAVVGLVNVV